MSELLQNILHTSFDGGIVIAAVLLLRLVLKKAPKKYACLLWMLALLRLLMPFRIESTLSLQPDLTRLEQPQTVIAETAEQAPVPAVPADLPLPDDVQVEYSDAVVSEPEVTVTVIEYDLIAAWVWLAGVCAMALYGLISYWKLKRRVREAVIFSDGVFECAGLETAFILGFLPGRIYIPMGLSEENRRFILAHERAHLRRGDHWVKLIGFIALSVHWFNPLVWAAYLLLCRDIEMACDEQVVQNMDLAERKSYSEALLTCSTGHRSIAACPVAFGEVSVKQRIISVLHYRKPAFWISITAAIAIVFVAVCFLTSPAEEVQDLSFLNYKNAVIPAAEQDVLVAVHYTAEDETGSIGIGMAEGKTLAEYLDNADWSEKWFQPSDRSSPGSVAFNISEDLRITVYDRNFAAVEYDEEVRYYRTGWGDYQKAVDILLPADEERLEQSANREFDISLGCATVAPDWGITIAAEDVTPGGLSLLITQSGILGPQTLYYGQDYSLERWEDGGWTAVEPIIENGAFDTSAFTLPENRTTRLNINWKWLYGELPADTYRISKGIFNEVSTQVGVDIKLEDNPIEETHHTYYVQFEIEADPAGTPDWGLSLTAANPSPTGLTLIYQRNGGSYAGPLETDGIYWLYRMTDNGWEGVRKVSDEAPWPSETTTINQDADFTQTIDWQLHYGTLSPGTYCLTKSITGEDASGNLFSYNYEAVFEIPGETAAPTEEELIQKCREHLESFQAQESYSLAIARTFTGDVLNDNSTQYFYRSGADWLRITSVYGVDQSIKDYYLEKDGVQYSRFTSEIHNPANGESGDTGWVKGPLSESEIFEPWPRTFRWDAQEVTFLSYRNEDDADQITFHVQGSPYPDREDIDISEYQITFLFSRNEQPDRVILTCTEHTTVFGGSGQEDSYIQQTADIIFLATAPDSIAALIDSMYAETIS